MRWVAVFENAFHPARRHQHRNQIIMGPFNPSLLIVLCGAFTTVAAERPMIPLWPNGLPAGSVQMTPAQIEAARNKTTGERIAYVGDPSLTLYRAPKEKANGCALIICPGGGYNLLAWPKEGLEVAEYFNSVGVTCAVLQYRVPRRDPAQPHAEPLQDAQRALRLMRSRATEWGVDPRRVGILGFSAGGHLTVMAGLHWNEITYPKVDAADEQSCRPDFICPIYPAYLADEKTPGPLEPLVKITAQTPPVFLSVTSDDQLRGYNAALFYLELKKAKVPAELHIFSKGGHGYGIRPSDNPVSTWHVRCAEWLKVSGFLKAGK